jgi:PHD/YefM family antitoxin component YafN of YafNO toxin-antitoxin module
MSTKTISSTEAQNNFGRILDDATQNAVRYVIQRRNNAQAILLSLSEFERLLNAQASERQELSKTISELSPTYDLGNSFE